MHANAALITRFYSAFQQRDADTMAACYHPEASFSDPAFPALHGSEIGDMWRMLLARGHDLRLDFSDVQADDQRGSAHWDARYTFSKTGRRVLNRIDAEFHFQSGLIVRHQDHFAFAAWAQQALGPVGWLLGYTPLLRNKVQGEAGKGLAHSRAGLGR